MFLLVLFLFTNAHAVYFTMNDINVTIPIDKGKPPSANQPLVTLYAIGKSFNYTLIRGKFFQISSAGDVSFTKEFQVDENLDNVSVKIAAKDRSSTDTANFNLDFQPLEAIDCDFIVEDLCFWKSARYQIKENTGPAIIGSLASPYITQVCATYDIKYELLSKNQEFRIVSRGFAHTIESTQALNREEKSKHVLEVSCTVENDKHSIRNVNRTIKVTVMDVDDNLPVPQENLFEISIASRHIHKNQELWHGSLIFHDNDSSAVNNYKSAILNDSLKILKSNCSTLKNDLASNHHELTAIHCKLKFTKNHSMSKSTYSVVLQLNDTTLTNGNNIVTVPIVLDFRDKSQLEMLRKKLQLYPSTRVNIFRTATSFARLTQPIPSNLNGAKNFTMRPLKKEIFSVTQTGGIVYVSNAKNLRTAPEYVKINISWIDNSSVKSDEMEVHIVDEPTKTCSDAIATKALLSCSEFATPEECLSPTSCALSTGGSPSVKKRESPQRCMWRGERVPPQESTTFYSTCTPDTETCPDEVCDPLEELDALICPQDCSDTVLFPSKINNATGRGIYRGSGVCTCTKLNCHCNPVEYTKFNKSTKKNKHKKEPPFLDETFHADVSKHTSNSTTKILGIELARCGTTCVFGIVAGVLVLGGTVALIMICWKLESVHKAVRKKFNEEAQDMSAPLSEYIDRSMPDPIPLNFNMTTSLADTAILNIINKYAPDPKWEFPRNQLIIEQTLGEGEFGKVLRAKARNIAGQQGEATVAVKTLKEDARESELNDLLSEYQLLKEVSHPNVIRLLGVCTAPGGPIYLIIEFAEHGSLRNYLRRSRHLKSECGRLPTSAVDDAEIHYDEPNISKVTPKEILSFAWQICKGMVYLSEIKLVHRDLAARNVLLAADKICKISDFGLTRDIYEDDAYFKKSKGRVPVKWMAPESLADHIYTNKSDVWSFGILVWELVTLGATPYPGIAVQNLFHLLRQGYRMERPDNCSPTLYNIMRSCWHIDPEQRPTFQELSALWEKMLSEEIDYLDLTNNAIHNRSYFCSPFDDNSGASEKSLETNPLNYLSKSQSYIKCGSREKMPEDSNFLTAPDNNQNDISAQGYETPVKVPKKIQTPTNDCPQYYTDMASGKSN